MAISGNLRGSIFKFSLQRQTMVATAGGGEARKGDGGWGGGGGGGEGGGRRRRREMGEMGEGKGGN